MTEPLILISRELSGARPGLVQGLTTEEVCTLNSLEARAHKMMVETDDLDALRGSLNELVNQGRHDTLGRVSILFLTDSQMRGKTRDIERISIWDGSDWKKTWDRCCRRQKWIKFVPRDYDSERLPTQIVALVQGFSEAQVSLLHSLRKECLDLLRIPNSTHRQQERNIGDKVTNFFSSRGDAIGGGPDVRLPPVSDLMKMAQCSGRFLIWDADDFVSVQSGLSLVRMIPRASANFIERCPEDSKGSDPSNLGMLVSNGEPSGTETRTIDSQFPALMATARADALETVHKDSEPLHGTDVDNVATTIPMSAAGLSTVDPQRRTQGWNTCTTSSISATEMLWNATRPSSLDLNTVPKEWGPG